MPLGFILQPTYRIESGSPVVHIYGKLQSGESFLIRDTQQIPHFYVRTTDAVRAADLGARIPDLGGNSPAVAKRNMSGEPVTRAEVKQPSDTPPLREKLRSQGIECFEADVRFAYRYLIDHGLRGSLNINGEGKPGDGVDWVFENPSITPGDWSPTLSVLSVDIETDPRAEQLLSIGIHGCGASEVLLLTPEGMSCPKGAIPFATQRDLIRGFLRRVRELDPDVLTGWNFVDFDLEVLQKLAQRGGIDMCMGRGPDKLRFRRASTPRGGAMANVEGRVVLDGIELLRGASVRMEHYGLESVAQQVLGRGKVITGSDRAGQILDAYRNDRQHLVDYNLTDARLVVEILEALKLIELTVERSRLTGMPPDRVAASIASFEYLYMSEMTARDIVAPTVGGTLQSEDDANVSRFREQMGGHVLDPVPGLYENVLVLDFRSLYPSLIRTFNIDPLGFLGTTDAAGSGEIAGNPALSEQDPILAPNGAAFRRDPGILPAMIQELFPRRAAAKKAGNDVASQAIKILMNSFYGVLGTPACRFASPDLANAITGFGRETLLWSKEQIESEGLQVLYGDTDSLFVLTDMAEPARARRLGKKLVEKLNRALSKRVEEIWRVDSFLKLEFEKLYLRLVLPSTRHGQGGARKRYAGLIEDDGERVVVFTGMEFVRSDWTELAKEVQKEVYSRLFHDEPLDEYVRLVVEEVRSGQRDGQLVYRKALRKRLEEYTASNPPHVAAARKLSGKTPRTIEYLITTGGPEPAIEQKSPIDHEHYVQKQVRAVAEPVLELLDLEFDKVVGDDRQLGLF